MEYPSSPTATMELKKVYQTGRGIGLKAARRCGCIYLINQIPDHHLR